MMKRLMSLKRSVETVNSLRVQANTVRKDTKIGAAASLAFFDIQSANLKDERLRLLYQSAKGVLESDQRNENSTDISKVALVQLMANTDSAEDFLALVACMAVVAPQSEAIWSDIDKRVTAKADSFSLDEITMTALIVASVADKLKIHSGHITSGRTAATLLLKNIDQLALFGECEITHNDSEQLKAISFLGFRMKLICSHSGYTNSTLTILDVNKLMSYCSAVMSAITINVPLHYLEPLWCSAALLKSTQSALFSNDLQRLIKESVSADPSQMRGQEKSVLAMLKFMKLTKTIDRELLAKLMSICDSEDFSNTKYGMSLVSLLIELDLEPEAMKTLSKVLENPINLSRHSLTLSEKARQTVFDQSQALSSAHNRKYDISNLIIAIFAFGSSSHIRNENQNRILTTIESELKPIISKMRIQDILILLNTYCLFQRYPLGIFREINQVIREHVEALSRRELEKVIWANARLNNRAEYNDRVAERLIAYAASTHFNHFKFSSLITSLWSLCVLERLSYPQYMAVEDIILKRTLKGSSSSSSSSSYQSTLQQLSQILFEVRAKAKKDYDAFPLYCGQREQSYNIMEPRPWELEYADVVNTQTVFTSSTHKDVSKTLNSMGISHENEKVVAGIYIADILIPSLSSIQHANGVIIEFDGPSHFENYSRSPSGPTLMKRRHLESAGYAVKSIPYWKYNTIDTTSKKEKLLNDLLGV